MSVDLASVVGFKSQDQAVSWNQRDLLTYAVGVGAKASDLSFVYELDKSWAPLPTYPVVLFLKGADADVNSFAQRVSSGKPPPGLPKSLDPKRVVHASQSIQILKDLPTVSGEGWKLTYEISAIHENKSGIIIDRKSELVDSKGTVYAKLFSASYYLGAKGTGEKFSKVADAAPQGKPVPKDRKPDWIIKDKTTPEQAIIFRLSGDYNPLHIDPKVGKATGFPGVILHGLSTFGFAARGLITDVAGGNPRALQYFGVRFTSPVFPGDALETHVWDMGPGPDGTTEVAFVTKNTNTGKICLGGGVAHIKVADKSKL